MSKEMIVSVNGREKKIAILDNGKVTEFYIERGEENAGVVGNVYKGRVMRVLPGMQSAFVDIGLERDAFLYVSDFFDEEEELERIVTEKSKKTSPDDAKREAQEQIDRARVEREKQIEAAQELVEPLRDVPEADLEEPQSEPVDERRTDENAQQPKGRARGERGRGRAERGQKRDTPQETSPEPEQEADSDTTLPPIELDFDASGFERVSDDDTGELFKDAFIQEAIVDHVRAIEFDIEPINEAEVGSVLAGTAPEAEGFQRIADDEEPAGTETTTAPAKKTRRKTKAETAEEQPKKKKAPAKRAASKGKFSKSSKRKTGAAEDGESSGTMADAEASEREPSDTAEMAIRRGGRGRRRGSGGKGRSDDERGDGRGDARSIDSAVDGNAEVAEAAPEQSEPRETRDRNSRGRDSQSNGSGRQDRRERGPQPTISDLLREGQEILVQIAKEPIAKKGARITSHIALPGRYLVYMPTIEHLGVSRKIESVQERTRLRGMIQRIRQDPEISSGGFIVRTAGVGVAEEDLRNDARYLARMWAESKKGAEKKKAPALIHQDLDLVQRLLRDQLADDFAAIRIDSEEEYLRTLEFINLIQPRMVNRIKLYTRDEPILEYYGVQEEVEKALKPRVWLKSGGYLVINQTEALVAIDVNTGKFVGKGNARLEDTITRTNLEAVEEIARQIRLRDLGGILVLDLIDMEDRRNRHKVQQALQEALQHDKSPTKVLSFNDFGLIIMTRKRVKQSLERTMCAPCDYCEGAGWVKSPTTVCYEILAEARRLSKSADDVRRTTLRVHPDVAKALRSTEREVLDEIEAYLGPIDVASDRVVHQAQFDFAFI
jgi:ribonuclease G